MSRLFYRTIANERPQGKPNVYFSCHPDDFDKYFEEYSSKILRIQDCAIWYESEPEGAYDAENLELSLSQMQLFIMPVTTKLLTEPNRAMDVEFPFAIQKHIPILPLMMEQGMDDVYTRRFGDLQYLDPFNTDETKNSFDSILTSYIQTTLVSDEMARKIRAAFDAYIFLSYRKKDRKMAQELMRLIHKNPICRDIAIWYDEFLTPGEDFNQTIEEMLTKSNLFALTVTPNLVNEVNYVMTTEYPAALAQNKPVFPVEMAETDRKALNASYEALPPCVQGEDGETFRGALLEKLKELAITANDDDPEHNYLIGLAYLDGIDVEVNSERALSLITGAADAGVMEAIHQLVTMYETGKGVARDYHKGIEWRKKYIAKLKAAYKENGSEENAKKLTDEIWSLGDAQYALGLIDEAGESYKEMCGLAEALSKSGNNSFERTYSVGLYYLGGIADAKGNQQTAEEYYEKALAISRKLSEETGKLLPRRDMSNCCRALSEIAKVRGDLDTAQKYLEESLEINKALMAETGTAASRRSIYVNYIRFGDLAKEREDLTGAQEYYEKAFEIIKLLAEETDSPEYRRYLSASYERLGRNARKKGELRAAREHFNNCLALNEALVKETGTIQSRRDLSVTYGELGELSKNEGDLAGAQEFQEKSLEIRAALAKETETVEARQDLAATINNLGSIAEQKGDLETAKQRYSEAYRIVDALAEENENPVVRQMLETCYGHLGDVEYLRGNLDSARELYEKSAEISKRIADEEGTIDSKYNLSVSYDHLGEIAESKGDLDRAQDYYKKSYDLSKAIAEERGTFEFLRGLTISCNHLGAIAKEKGDLAVAQDYYEKALEIRKKVAGRTGTVEARRDLSVSHNRLGEIANLRGDTAGAKEHYERCLDIRKHLAQQTNSVQYVWDLAVVYYNYGIFCYNAGDKARAKELFEELTETGLEYDYSRLEELRNDAKQILEEHF